ncbi:MAG: lipopolysaccharide assembly protein LapA domain-containing protein [Acidimicrobiia bacterium]|nr:lipopolysaccharide assembly protein LapA domain-containing protein [Acidimicrobiia bacterium]MDH5422439.1 lipopolysaccharide assembly protein LapA domain-containing protein [Acidimicrobiia bacterium]MDH5503265.1 lipopolysaccharide assembly protein LapA domain-containing protein [Acidimicrobiia bacterium]
MNEEEPTPTGDEIDLSPSDGIDLTDTEVMPLGSGELPTADAPVEETVVAPVTPTTVYKGSGFRWSMLFGALLLAVVIILVFQNTQTTRFDFLQWSIEAPLAALLLGTTLIAVLIDEIVGYVIRIRRRRIKRQLAELKELKAQLEPPKERRFGKKTS